MEQRLLDYRGAVALVLANTIGTGVFTTSGFALADLGAPAFVMLAWFTGGIYALCGVVIYADLATRFPQSGGEYIFLNNTLHPALGTIAGWVSIVAGFTSPIAAAALGAQLYLARVFPLSSSLPIMASLIILSLGLIHAFAPSAGVRFQNAAVLIKVIAILFFILAGIAPVTENISTAAHTSQPFSVLAFAGSLVWISFAYSGWNAAVYVTSDITGGGATVKRALYTGTGLVMVLYLGVSAVILYGGAPLVELRGVAESGAAAARALGGTTAERALSLVIGLALITSASSMLLSGPRVYAKMAHDGVLPAIVGRLHNHHPRVAVLAQMLVCLGVVWNAQLRELLEFAGVMLSLSAGTVIFGWIVLELKTGLQCRLLLLTTALIFLIATGAIAIAEIMMRPQTLIAVVILISFALMAHYYKFQPMRNFS